MMASVQSNAQSWEWAFCKYCPDTKFNALQEFKRHLREHHCLQEAGSFVCCYGYRGICTSMSLNGVAEAEYLKHVNQYHINGSENATNSNSTTSTNASTSSHTSASSSSSVLPTSHTLLKANSIRRFNGSETSAEGSKWTVYSGSQNLPAVLNDPNRGKQKDFFTKLWGDTFVEKTDIPPPSYLPEITRAHFESYLRKIGKRHRKYERMKANVPAPTGHAQVLHTFPNLRVPSTRHVDKYKYDVDTIPSIFLQSAFSLCNLETFNAVYNLGQSEENPDTHKSISAIMGHSGKILQEKLTQHLDTVELQISHQVAHKSDAFFLAMRSHDALMEHMTDTISVVKTLRENIHQLDKGVVQESLRLLKLKRTRNNYMRVYQKLKLMSSVHQTQPMIQLLLSTPDYVAALDLIQTSQEMSQQKLAGIHSFRHLGPQLLEMGRLIDKMLSTEFERYATADLNRPLGADTGVLEGDKLVSIILGLLRQKKFDFIDAYKAEAFTTIRAVVKQSVIEVLACSEAPPSEGDMSLTEQMQALTLTLPEWCRLFQQCTETLKRLILRVKAAADIMRDAAKVSAGSTCASEETNQTENGSPSLHVSVCEPPDVFLNSDELTRVCSKLDEMLCAVCDSAHERCASLLTAQQSSKHSWERDPGPSVSPSTSSGSGTSSSSGTSNVNTNFSSSNGSVSGNSSGWLVERATAAQVCLLSQIVEDFCSCCQQVCGRQSAILRTAFKMQANKFVIRFHQERRTKLDLILSSERWRQADVPAEFQALVNKIHQSGEFGTPQAEAHPELEGQPPGDKLRVGDDQFAVVGTVLILIRVVAEYCGCATDLPLCAAALCRSVAELLALFNSRCCQLVLGAGAVQSAGLQTITTTNLALASRALQLLLWLIPKVRAHFTALLDSSANTTGVSLGTGSVTGALTLVDNAERDVCSHIEEIEAKVLTIMSTSIAAQLGSWDARPPVPSQSFRNVTKHLFKLHKAVGTILPANQIRELYRAVHVSFKDKLRETLAKNGVVNNGGPQHGVVTTELTFYLEALRSLHVLPNDEVNEQSLEDLWR